MTKLNTKSLLIIVVILLIGIVAIWQIQRGARPATAGWFNDAWQYRKGINIGYTGASDLTDFQVSVDIGTSALIAAGKMKSDCSDIRFTDQNGNLLNYWIEENNPGCNKIDDTKIWIKVPTLHTTGTEIYVYYGNSQAEDKQNGEEVFEFFDDFSQDTSFRYDEGAGGGFSINTNESRMELASPDGSFGYKLNKFNHYNYIYHIREQCFSGDDFHFTFSSDDYSLIRNGSINSSYFVVDYGSSNWRIQGMTPAGTRSSMSNDLSTWYSNVIIAQPTWYKIWWNTSDINDTPLDIQNSNVSYPVNNGYFGGGVSSSTVYIDHIFLRKYNDVYDTINTNFQTEERSPAPIAYWTFDEGVGTTVYDSSQRNNHRQIVGADWSKSSDCVSGTCLYFDGNGTDYINTGIGQSWDISVDPLSISMWVKPSSPAGSQIYISPNQGTDQKFYFATFQNNWDMGIQNAGWGGGGSGVAVDMNKWSHINIVADGSKVYLYLNGKKIMEKSYTSYTFPYNLYLGQHGTSSNYSFHGYLDEVKIYSYARSSTQIKQDYRAGLAGMKTQKGSSVAMGGSSGGKSLSDGLVGYWKMDEGVGTTTADSSGNSNIGYSIPSWFSGKFGLGASYGGSTFSTLSNNSVYDFRNDFTFSAWIKPTNIATGNYKVIAEGGTGNDYARGWYVRINQDGNLGFEIGGGGSTSSWIWAGAGTITINQWYLVTAEIKDTTMNLFVNGNLVKTGTYVGSRQSALPFTLANYNGGDWNFYGTIDEVRLYNRALSPSEVTALYEYAPGPVAYYDFEEGVGTTLYDRSGNGNNGVWQGTLGNHYSAGKVGQAGEFNGSDNYVNINSSSSLNIEGPITLETWVKPSIGSGQQGIIGTYGHSTAYSLYLRNTDNADIGFWNNINGTTNYTMQGTMDYGKWTHLASVWDGSKINLYQNGTLIYSGIGSSASNARNFQGLYLGYTNSIAIPRYFNGLIDEVKIYNYARTQKQILQDMHASAPVGGMSKINKPIAWYKFDEGYGTVANNSGSIGSTSNGIFGTGNSAPTWTNGKFGKALILDGSDYVFLPGSNLENIGAVGDFTVTAWNNQSSFSDVQVIVGQGFAGAPGGHTYGRWQIGTNGSKGHISLYGGSSSPSYKRLTGLTNLQVDTWNHITAIYSRREGKLKLYINGKYDSQLTWDGYIENVFANRMAIGYNSGTNAQYMNGLIDEVKIYNYALSDDEIKQDYNQGATAVIGKSTQTIGATTTSLDYCIPGDTSYCAAPIAEYNFEEGVGTTAYDTSGNGNHCYTSNNPLWVSGKTGGALQFNGSNQRCTKTGGVTIGQITAQAWVYRTSSTTNQGIIRQQNSFILSLKDDTIQLGGTSFLNTGITIPLNLWQHVAWTNDSHNHILFINGQEKWRNSGGTLPNNTNDLNVAYDNNNWWWGGKIDSVKVYNYARTPAQIAYDYNKGAPIAHWKMNECQGTTINDSSGNNNHGTLNIGVGGSQSSVGTCQSSGAWYNGRTGKINSAMSFDGTDDYVSINSLGSTLTSTTISAWIKISSSTGNWQVPLALGSNPTINIACESSDNQKCGCDLYNAVTNPVDIGYNNWTLITCVKTPSGMTQYINGKYSSYESNASSITNPIINIARGRTNEYYTRGLIDDVRIYNYALTSEQVKQIYNGGAMNFR